MINGRFTDEEKGLISERTRLAMANTELRQRLSDIKKGHIPWNKGHTGLGPSWNSGRSNLPPSWNKGLKGYMAGEQNGNWKGGASFCACGAQLSRHECHQCDACFRKFNRGPNHYKWKGGMGQPFRRTGEYRQWRMAVCSRDSFACRMPGCEHRGKYMVAHHIVPVYENLNLVFDVSNGITLCRSHHYKTQRKENQFVNLFQGVRMT